VRIFVYEYTCSLSPAEVSLPASLRVEGGAMLQAILEDLGRAPKVDVVSLLHPGVSACAGTEVVRQSGQGREKSLFQAQVRTCDAVLVIAPESDGLLEERCRWVEDAGGKLAGPSVEAVRLAGDKWALAGHLEGKGVPTPPCYQLPGAGCAFPAVCKPRDGAGSEAVFLLQNAAELDRTQAQARAEGFQGEWILQPYVPGMAASVAFLVGAGGVIPLLPASQELSTDGRFHYDGGRVPLSPLFRERAVHVGRRAVEAVAGLRGYVGVDMVLGTAGDTVIEINPRLTTSYLGLRQLAVTNLAVAMIQVATGDHTPELCWREGQVRFYPDGRITV
jgi:predicted ATP-grasp superfamily ATP-dependent carboligase